MVWRQGAIRVLFGAAVLGATVLPGAGEPYYQPGENPVSVILKWRPTTPDPEVRDFVKQSRPADGQLDYKPLTGPAPQRPKVKSKHELGALMNDMDRASAALRQKAGQVGGAPSASVQQMQQAAAESRRRAAEEFGESAPATPKPAKAGRKPSR